MADADSNDPVLRNPRTQKQDKLVGDLVGRTEKFEKKHRPTPKEGDSQTKNGPAGGFDATAVPKAPNGYTIKFTFHRAENLPFADIQTISSDPYVLATLKTNLPKRHKTDPDLKLRTKTIHRNVNPVWDTEWVVANVPASGFFLKCRLYDEDPADHDDRLGNVHVNVDAINENWEGFKERKFDVKKRMGSKRAYLVRGCATLFTRNMKMGGDMIISVENLGKTESENGGRMWTVGPLAWSRHYSPLIGRLVGTKDVGEEKDGKKNAKYNFQAIQMQLAGPVPEPLYHRYVEFKPFVAGMFTSHSLRGRLLNRALHHQHARIYNYDRSTLYGIFPKPSIDMTKQFLEFVKYDVGGRIFTYVLTLDALWRFTETGKEFGIDMLSKHTMHSDVSIYIAFSGEFFIRRLKHPHRDGDDSPNPSTEALPPAAGPTEAEEIAEEEERPHPAKAADPDRDPSLYELIIDNDSGTYRPNAKYLHTLKEFMAANLPGLRVVTLDCKSDEEKMNKLKGEQRERKKNSAGKGNQMTYLQNSSQSSISSSDEEELNQRAEGENHEHGWKKEMTNLKGAVRGRGIPDDDMEDDRSVKEKHGSPTDEKVTGEAQNSESAP